MKNHELSGTGAIDCSVILGTVQRPVMLRECVKSVRESLGGSRYTYEIVVAYGDDSDLSLPWMNAQSDVRPVLGGLNGAIEAFNRAYQVSRGRFICQINDDVIIQGASIPNALRHLEEDPALGAVVFRMSRDGGVTYPETDYPSGQVPGLPHPNQMVAKRETCEEIIADGFGAFWGDATVRTHRTYGGDSAWGLRASRLGWKLERRKDVYLLDRMDETVGDPNRRLNCEKGEYERHEALWKQRYPDGYSSPLKNRSGVSGT